MKTADIAKIESFLKYYSAIHQRAGAYAGHAAESAHREAADRLFANSLSFVASLPLENVRTLLDVGAGYGQHCALFASKGLQVTGLTAHLTAEVAQHAAAAGYQAVGMDMHFIDMPDASFDLVWSHHSLEHSFGPLLALREWLRVLCPGGWLALTVPPHKAEIVSGHFNVGWSVGQLIYLLGVAGYELQGGRFFEEGYNVRALVRKPVEPIDTTGLSWMHALRTHLPASIQERLKNAPRSLGGVTFRGDLAEITDDIYRIKASPGPAQKNRS